MDSKSTIESRLRPAPFSEKKREGMPSMLLKIIIAKMTSCH